MNRGITVGAWCVAVASLAAGGAACGPITSTPGPGAPANSCPEFPCTGYESSSVATCQAGACVADGSTEDTGSLILVVAVPTDSSYAPGRTFAVTLDDLLTPKNASGCVAAGCCLPDCAPLPGIEVVSRSYVIEPSLEQSGAGVGYYLGSGLISLPIQSTYQPRWGGPTGPFATALGLPLESIPSLALLSPILNPGPNGSLGTVTEAYLQVGLSYQVTDQPAAPFSSAYPPEIVSLAPEVTGDAPIMATVTVNLDLTTETGSTVSTIPTFDISRAAGLDGWTAYLRDATNLNTVSNVVTLVGTESPHVELATNRFSNPRGPDALTNAQLVIAPPAGLVAPTEILAPAGNELPSVEQYPATPDPVTISAEVTLGGASVPADLLFEATNIISGGVITMSNFTYTARASTSVDPVTGRSTFTVQLPPGQYLVVARPASASPDAAAVTLASLQAPEEPTQGAGQVTFNAPAVKLAATQPVIGRLLTADRRPLSEATVEAIPTGCALLPAGIYDSPFLTTAACLPRSAQTVTATDGSFALALDPGEYLLRARPFDGSKFPWLTTTVSVAGAAVILAPMVVPVPASVGLRLVDPNDNPIVQAVVRAYSLPDAGQAIEVGSALTDENGHYDMFVTLAQP